MFNFIKDNPITCFIIVLALLSPSFFIGALQVVGYVVLGIVILMLILGLVFRAKISRLQSQMEEQMRNQQGGGYERPMGGDRHQNSNEGDVEILKQRGSGEKKVANDVGDYVEFEEVENGK